VRRSGAFTGEKGGKVGQVGLRRFRPHLPHKAKKPHGNCGLQKGVGQVGLARARVIWRGINYLSSLVSIEKRFSYFLSWNNRDSRPHLPQTVIFCAFQRTICQNRQAPSSPRWLRPHLLHFLPTVASVSSLRPLSDLSKPDRGIFITVSSEHRGRRVERWPASQTEVVPHKNGQVCHPFPAHRAVVLLYMSPKFTAIRRYSEVSAVNSGRVGTE
jgi:hypothetical protein